MKLWRDFSFLLVLAPLAVVWGTDPSVACGEYPDLYEASIQELGQGLDRGRYTSVDLVTAYLARIDEVNLKGAELRAVLEINHHALEQAAALDLERRVRGKRSPLHGIPILVKDNIAIRASDGMNTTAGSYALLGSIVPGDATVVAKLRKAGAILLGKANLSEWSYWRDRSLVSGWSARGGQVTNPYYPGGDPCGSSAGSAAATAVGLTAASLGTETDGSIICPASYNNLAAIKPTVGLTSRAGVIPISSHQDSVGPIARSVADAAAILSIIAGRDRRDNYTSTAPAKIPNYTDYLDPAAIKGKRFGVPRHVFTDDSITPPDVEFNNALEIIRSLGGIVVDPTEVPNASIMSKADETLVFTVDFKVDFNRYLETLERIPTNVTSLTELIAFNVAHEDLEGPGQAMLISSESTSGYNSTYYDALRSNHLAGRELGIDAALRANHLDALVLPSKSLSWWASAIAGYPIVTVPLGFYPDDTPVEPQPGTIFPAPGIPFGLSFLGTAYSEPSLIGFAYAYEQHTHTRLARRAYPEAVPKTQLKDVIGVCSKLNAFTHQN